MNIVIIGDDPAILPWIDAIAHSGGKHQILCATGLSAESTSAAIPPHIPAEPRWDTLLARADVNAAIVCGQNPEALEVAKQFAAAGKALIVLPRSAQGSTWVYELGLIRDEVHTPIVPGYFDRLSPALQALRARLQEGSLGRLLFVEIDRSLPAQHGSRLLDRESVDDALLEDVDLLRMLGGDYSRVNAIDSGVSGERVSVATAILSGDGLPEAKWSSRAGDVPSTRLNATCEHGALGATADGWPRRWQRADGEAESDDPRRTILEQLDGLGASLVAGTVPPARWDELVRSFEIVDGVRRSLRRRRAIDLHFESTSERSQFKSQMTAIGCVVLVFTFFAVLFLLIAMPMFDIRSQKQIEAERARAVLYAGEFAAGQAALPVKLQQRLAVIAERTSGTRFPIWIECTPDPDVDEDRQRRVIEQLTSKGVEDAAQRTMTGKLVGQWYPPLLRLVRIAAFTPLVLFLLAQFLVRLAKPSAGSAALLKPADEDRQNLPIS